MHKINASVINQSTSSTELDFMTIKNRKSNTPSKTTTFLNFHGTNEQSFQSRTELWSSKNQTEMSTYPRITLLNQATSEETQEDSENKNLSLKKKSVCELKDFPESQYIVSDCWETTSGEIPVKFLKILSLEGTSDNELVIPLKKIRVDSAENADELPPYTKEFHILNEVQKTRILNAVEDSIKKLASLDVYYVTQTEEDKQAPGVLRQRSLERFFCKKFLLPWVVMKVVEMVLCHLIQFIFLSENSYFQKKNDFLPIVVTFYLTLFIVILSLVVHISCFSYAGLQNLCYIMGTISFSIFTLTTTFGVLIMLALMGYYKTLMQILVLFFICLLICSFFGELCLCYFEVKTIWNRVALADQCFVN